MVFCKKCHKRVIDVVTTKKDFYNRCRCDATPLVEKCSEMTGVIGGMLCQRRSGCKRQLVKELGN